MRNLIAIVLTAYAGACAAAGGDAGSAAGGPPPYPTAVFAPGDGPATRPLNGHVVFRFSDPNVNVLARAPFVGPVVDIPEIEVDLVTDGGDLIPIARGLMVTDHASFDLFVSPGRVWSEGTDHRGSLPFTLVSRDVNCAHNGLLGFRYSATTIDEVRVLINQETCHFLKFDMWGPGVAHYVPYVAEGRQAAVAVYRDERRFPVKPLAALEQDHGVAPGGFLVGLPDGDDLTYAGVLLDGVHYRTDCRTRGGPYPYCDYMLGTSFSTAKTAFPALVLMTLAQDRGVGVYSERVIDYLPEARLAKGDWRDVTFDHLGDMTSGNFSNGEPLADAAPGNFYADLDRDAKLAAAFSWPNGAAAGSRFVYQTADTFILVAALDSFLARQRAASRDAFEFLTRRVLEPLGVPVEVRASRRTRDGGVINSGTAFGGMGMFWTPDALLKVMRLMAIDDGRIGDTQVLHPAVLARTLQRDDSDRGITTRFFSTNYNNGTWALPVSNVGDDESCDVWVPFMSGLSGVRAMFMPNGVLYYYFNDAQAFPSMPAIGAANALRPFCVAPPDGPG